MPVPLSRQLFGFASMAVLFALLALLPLPAVHFLDIPVFYNGKEATLARVLFLLLLISGIFWTFRKNFPTNFMFPLGLVAAGALSNISYRLLVGPVPDYIPLPGSFYANAADMTILLGILLFFFLALRLLWQERSWPFVARANLGPGQAPAFPGENSEAQKSAKANKNDRARDL